MSEHLMREQDGIDSVNLSEELLACKLKRGFLLVDIDWWGWEDIDRNTFTQLFDLEERIRQITEILEK